MLYPINPKRVVSGSYAFRVFACVLVVLAFFSMPAMADNSTPGVISNVTVYRGQALVTRTVEVKMPADAAEIIVTDLPWQILPETLYAQTSENLSVLSVRYRERAVQEDTREEVKNLQLQIETVKRQLKHLERNHAHLHNTWNYYEPFWTLTVQTAGTDFNRALMQFEPIQKLTELLENKFNDFHQNSLSLEDQIEDTKKDLSLLERQRQTLAAGQSRTEREAVVYLRKNDDRSATLDLSYLVNGANWSPQYNLRARPDDAQVLIEYNAVVHQTSGEDWSNVALALSTAQPTMAAAPPALEPMMASLTSHSPKIPVSQRETGSQKSEFLNSTQQFQKLLQSRRDNIKKGKAAEAELNLYAADNQSLTYNTDYHRLRKMQEQVAEIARIEGVSVTYTLPGQLSLPSRSDQQMITIAAIPAKAEFTLIATPLLTDYVYLQADLLNSSDTILLPGPASMFRNGDFCGKSDMSLVTIGEQFTAGFGIDSQIQVTRELANKKSRVQGGNRIDTYKYRIALANYKDTRVSIRLLDRLPYTNSSSIKIELGKISSPLSKDSEYLRTLRKKNILRWDLDLEPNTIGNDATVVTYAFTMEYDRNMKIHSQTQRQ